MTNEIETLQSVAQTQKAGLVSVPTAQTELQMLNDKMDSILAQLQPITELFMALSDNPMLKQFLR